MEIAIVRGNAVPAPASIPIPLVLLLRDIQDQSPPAAEQAVAHGREEPPAGERRQAAGGDKQSHRGARAQPVRTDEEGGVRQELQRRLVQVPVRAGGKGIVG